MSSVLEELERENGMGRMRGKSGEKEGLDIRNLCGGRNYPDLENLMVKCPNF